MRTHEYVISLQHTGGTAYVQTGVTSLAEAKRIARAAFLTHRPMAVEIIPICHHTATAPHSHAPLIASQTHGGGMLWR